MSYTHNRILKNENVIYIDNTFIVIDVIKSTKTKAFSSLKIGDKMYFSTPLIPAGKRSSGTYAVNIKCKNLQTEEIKFLSFNEIYKVLNCFIFKDVNNLLDI